MSADVLAFTQLSGEYDQLYKQESTQRVLTNDITELEGIYANTNLDPDPEVAGFIESVQSNVGGTGYSTMQASPEQRRALSQELSRARNYLAEYDVRTQLKADIDSMREFLTALRAGRVPEGSTISPEVVKQLSELRLNESSEDGDTGSATLTELVGLLNPSSKTPLNPWDPDQDVSKLQDQVRQATGLFEILGTQNGLEQHDLALEVRKRMEKEKRLFTERNQVASMVQAMRREQPDGPMSPIERWASRHMENAGSGRFDLTYDDDAEYQKMWKAISDKAAALGGDTQMAIVAMNQAWRDAAPTRAAWDEMERSPSAIPREYDDTYYQGYVDDVLASQAQFDEEYDSADPRVDNVVNLVPEKGEADFFERGDSLRPVFVRPGEESLGITDTRIRMRSDGGYAEKRRTGTKEFVAETTLNIALKQAGISREEYFGYEFKRMGSADDDWLVEKMLQGGQSREDGMRAVTQMRVYEATRTTFAEFAEAKPALARKLLHALQNPDPAWREAWEDRDTSELTGDGTKGWGKRRLGKRPPVTERHRRNLPPPPDPNRQVGGPAVPPSVVGSLADGPNADPEAFQALMDTFDEPEPQLADPNAISVEMSDADRARTALPAESPEPPYAVANRGMDEAAMLENEGGLIAPELRENVEQNAMRTLSPDNKDDMRTPVGDASPMASGAQIFADVARGETQNARGQAMLRVELQKARSMRMPDVERELMKLERRRERAANGKLTMKDAARYGALMSRYRQLRQR